MADDDPGPRRPGPAPKLSWTSIIRKMSTGTIDTGSGGDAADTPKASTGGAQPVSRPGSLGATSFRAATSFRTGLVRAPSAMGAAPASGAGKDATNSSGVLGVRSQSHVHAGLLAPGQGNGTTADVVTAVKDLQLRKRSIMFQQVTSQTGPSLQTRTGCLATYFFAPNPTPGKGVCFSPDGAFVMRWGYGTDVKLLAADDGVLVNTMVAPTPGAVHYAGFNSDGRKLVVSTEDCKVYVWATANKHLISALDVGLEPLAHIVFSSDSKQLLSCDDEGQLELWDIHTASMVRRYETGHISKRCGFSVDGQSVISCAGDDCGLVLLNMKTGGVEQVQLFEEVAESRHRACYAISPDGTKVLMYVTEQVYGINLVLYHTDTDAHFPLMVCDGAVTHADFSNDSSLFITAGRDDLIHVWESETGMLRTTLEGHASDVMFCKISEDGDVAVSGDSEGTVLVWSLAESACVMRLQAHASPLAYVDVNEDGTRALTVDTEGHALLWFLDAARMFEVMRQHSDLVCCVAPTPDGSSLVAGYKDGCLRCWNVCDGPGLTATVTWTHNKQACPVEQLVMRPDGAQVAAAGRDGSVVITDMRRGLVVATLNGHNDFVTGLLFSERSDVLVTASRVGEVFVWNAKSYGTEPLRHLEVPELMEVAALAISPNQAFLAAATAGGSVHVWSLQTFLLQSDVKVTDLPATRLTFNNDASVLAVGSADGSVTLVDPLTGIKAAYYKGNASSINDVTFMSKPDHMLLSVCGRQAIKWDCRMSSMHHVTDFIADSSRIFSTASIGTIRHRTCVAHDAVVLYDPINHAAMYDMLPRPPEQHPGNSYLFRHGTSLTYGLNKHPMVLYCAPDTTVHMLSDETGGTRCLDFSSDGRLLVSGTLRGELCVWDVVHQQLMHKWVAHKRYSITCVRFTHDATNVYSCAEDCKVIMWDWRRQTKLAVLTGHQAPVQAVEMSVDGTQMASGDRDGLIFIWDTVTHTPKQVIPAHEGSVLCCSLSPCGTMVASTGNDEHIVILDVHTGHQLAILDDAMDGKGLTIKFSFDGTRLLVGGEKGAVLIWDVARNCLLYDIPAHDGKVFDCCWSGDSRRLLSVGSDGKARLWDAAAGSELCQANFERVMGAVESGGFVHCDLSATGNRMAGCTAKGQLIDWDVGAELRCVPEGSMLYQRLSSLSVGRSREIYTRLLREFPLLPNTQDSRGWTILMHAVANSNPEITKLIIGSVPPASGKLGLTASAVQNSILSSIRHVPRVQMLSSTSGATSQKDKGGVWEGSSKRLGPLAAEGSSKVLKLGAHSAAVSSKKLSLPEVKDEDEDEEGDGEVGDDRDSRLGGGTTQTTTAAAATAEAAETSSGQQVVAVTSPTSAAAAGGGGGSNLFVLGRMGSFLRTSADLLSPNRERASPVAESTAAAAATAAATMGVNAAISSPQVSGALDTAAAMDGAMPSRSGGSGGDGGEGGSRGSILKTSANRTSSSPQSSMAQVATAQTLFLSETASGSLRLSNSGGEAAAGFSGGSAHGGNAAAAGGITYATGRRSLLGSVLEAEREREEGSRSRRRSFMFGSVPPPPTAAGGGSNLATTNLGRSIRYAMNKLTRAGSRNAGGTGRDMEEGGGREDSVDVRHVSDLSRGGWQEEEQDPSRHNGGHGGKDGGSSQAGPGIRGSNKVWPEPQSPDRTEPNVVKIALDAGAADCVQHVLDAVLGQKVTPGSYHAITAAIPAVAQQYPTMCQVFLSGLPLRHLGEMEVPASIAARGMTVISAPSYTSYKEMWMNELRLKEGNKGPMALMEACMVRLPFAAASGKSSVLHTLVESSVPVQTFGSDTVKAIVDYKWRNFAERRIYIKALVYLLYTVLFTVFAALFAEDDGSRGGAENAASMSGGAAPPPPSQRSLHDLVRDDGGVAIVVFACVLFVYGIYFLVLECMQLVSLGVRAYFDSFWNIVDIAAYVTTLVICPCTVFRYGIGKGEFVPALVAAEVIMLWVKVLFFGLAIDGVGSFIFMTSEIIKGLKYFIIMLATLFVSFAVAFMVLFRNDEGEMGDNYGNFGQSLLNVYLVMFSIGDPHSALTTEFGHFAILLFCVYMFALLVFMLNMIITLMADIFQRVKGIQHFVFLKGRAELIIDVESTTGGSLVNADHPYLHLLMPLRKEHFGGASDGDEAAAVADDKMASSSLARVSASASAGPGGAGLGGGGGAPSRAVSLSGGVVRSGVALPDGASEVASDDDDGRSVIGGPRLASRLMSFKSMRSFGGALLAAGGGGGGGASVRRQGDAFSTLGGTTMARRANIAAAAAAAATDVDRYDRLERLERAVNRLTSNLEAVMTHLKIRRPSNSGGPGGLSGMDAPAAPGPPPVGRRGAQRSTATGIGGAGGSPGRGGGPGGSFGLPGGVSSRAPSRPTSAYPVMSRQHTVVVAAATPPLPSSPPPTAAAATPAGAALAVPHSMGSPGHSHHHATFADQYASLLASKQDAEAAQRVSGAGGVAAGAAGSTAGSRSSTSGAGTAPPKAVPTAGGSPAAGGARSSTPEGSRTSTAATTTAAAAVGPGRTPARGGLSPHILTTTTGLDVDDSTEVQAVISSPVAAAPLPPTPASPVASPSGVPSRPSDSSSSIIGANGSTPRQVSSGSVRGGGAAAAGAATDVSARSGGSASSSAGGVAAAARLVLDPEEPPAWGGSGPGRPAGGANGGEPPRIRTPGEVEQNH